MHLHKQHYFKKSDSFLHFYFVRHDGHGLMPKFDFRKVIDKLYFYFKFTWWRFEIYQVRKR